METWTEKDVKAAAADQWELRTVEGRYAVLATGSRGLFTISLMGNMAATVGWKPFDPMTPLYRKALALHGQPVPAPKREPTLLEAAKEAVAQLDYLQKYAPVGGAWSDRVWRATDALNTAIAREEANPADVKCARCGKSIPQDFAFVEEGDEWECARCWHRCEEKELRDEIARLKASPATNEKLIGAICAAIGASKNWVAVGGQHTTRSGQHLLAALDRLSAAAKDAGIIP